MATIARDITTLKNTHVNAGWYERTIRYLQGCYFGVVAMSIPLASIIGGIALMYILKNHAQLWELALSVILVLAVNIWAVLAESVKWIINLLVISLVINATLIFINFSPIP